MGKKGDGAGFMVGLPSKVGDIHGEVVDVCV